jgi:hypothetical protein
MRLSERKAERQCRGLVLPDYLAVGQCTGLQVVQVCEALRVLSACLEPLSSFRRLAFVVSPTVCSLRSNALLKVIRKLSEEVDFAKLLGGQISETRLIRACA